MTIIEWRREADREPYRIGFQFEPRRWFVYDCRTDDREIVKEFRGKDARDRAVAYAARMNDEARRWGL